jgi:hypothetical protein
MGSYSRVAGGNSRIRLFPSPILGMISSNGDIRKWRADLRDTRGGDAEVTDRGRIFCAARV